MKSVFKTKELAHVWLWGPQVCANTGRDGSLSFNSDGIFSYATCIGKKLDRNGNRAYLINETSYSNTTCKHQNYLDRAIPSDRLVFRVGNQTQGTRLQLSGAEIFDYSMQSAAKCAKKATTALTKKDHYIAQQAFWIKQAKKVKEFFGLRRKIDDKVISRLQARIKKEQLRQQKEAKEQQEKLVAIHAEQLQNWIDGKLVSFPHGVNKVYLRECPFSLGSYIETSLGVRVSLSDAKRAFQFVMAHKEKLWERNGQTFTIGDYSLDRVTKDGVKAGCHFVSWEEIERFAKTQGWK